MKRKHTTKVFLLLLSVSVVAVLGHNFKQYYLDKNYLVEVITSCDPVLHSCFETDPNNPNPDLQIPIYEKVEVNAADAPSCLDEHSCTNFSCEKATGVCRVTYCTAETKIEGEICSNEIQ